MIAGTTTRPGSACGLVPTRRARPGAGQHIERVPCLVARSETFTAIWRSAGSYRPERGPGGPWLYAVPRNAIVDQARRRSEPAAEVPDSASDEEGPPQQAESAGSSRRLHRALAELPENERTLIELAY